MRKNFKKIKSETKAKNVKRKLSIRSKLSGTTERPRVCAVKTNKHLSVQVIDDVKMVTLFSVQTFGKKKTGDGANATSAEAVGAAVSKKLKSLNIDKAVFDRNGRKFTGIVAKVADSIRNGGIQI